MKEWFSKHLSEQLGIDDPEVQREFFAEYRTSAAEMLEEMHRAIGQNEMAQLRRLAHSLKGSALMIGDESMRDLALILEDYCEAADMPNCKNTLKLLAGAVKRLE